MAHFELVKLFVNIDEDKDYVEFIQDYAPRNLGKGRSPYAKFYRDLKSNKRFMVVSGLPMVKPDGEKFVVGFISIKNGFRSKANKEFGRLISYQF